MLSNKMFTLLLDKISDAFLVENIDRKVVLVNQKFCDLFSIPLSPEKLVGFDCATAAIMAAPMFKDPEAFTDRIQEILAEKKTVKEDSLELADGTFFVRDYIPVEENNNQTGHIWIYKNRTLEIELSKKFTYQEEFYKNILNNIPADIALFTPEHRYLFVNQNGIANEEIRNWIIGKDDFDYVKMRNIPSGAAEFRRAHFNEALSSGETIEFEDVSVNKKGFKVHNLRKFYPHKDDSGQIDFVIGYGVNIDNIKQKQTMLERSEYNFKNLLVHLNEVVLTLDAAYRITFVNPVWEYVMGYHTSATMGISLKQFIGVDTFHEIVEMIDTHKKSKQKVSDPKIFTINNKFGHEKHLKFNISITESPITEEIQIMVFIYDVTEQTNATLQLQKMMAQEKEMNEIKKSLINMVSHELRTPLAIIQSTIELMEIMGKSKTINIKDAVSEFTNIKGEIKRMTEIMDALMLLSKSDNEKAKFKPTLISPHQFAKNAIDNKFIPWHDGRNLQIAFKGKSHKVWIDVFACSRILNNIIDNAFKYSTVGQGVFLSVRCSNTQWSILVVDYGIGIQERDKSNLFSSFKRGGNVFNIPGTGMGLVIVRYFLQGLQGTIHIKSTQQKGTIVYVTFPHLPAHEIAGEVPMMFN